MPYAVEVDASPVYELLLSLHFYLNEMSPDRMANPWRKKTGTGLSQKLGSRLAGAKREFNIEALTLLTWQCAHKDSVDMFLNWLSACQSGELYDKLNPYLLNFSQSISNLAEWRAKVVEWLTVWKEVYFFEVPEAELSRLKTDAIEKQFRIASTENAEEFVECFLRGMTIEPVEPLRRVLLFPGIHYAPANLRMDFIGMMAVAYPLPERTTSLHSPLDHREVARKAKALGDETRVQILSALSHEPCRFTDIAKRTGIAKSTLHNHLITLRDAGFIRLHAILHKADQYSLRDEAFLDLHGMLDSLHREIVDRVQ